MKYQFYLPRKIRDYCEWELRHYWQIKKSIAEREEEMMPPITTKWSETPSGTGTSKPTENTALRLATSVYILEAEKRIRAIDICLTRLSEDEQKLIDLVYIQNRYTVDGAAMKIGFSRSSAYRTINSFLCSMALELGMVTIK